VLFTPLMAWIVHTYSWHHVFTVMGVVGIALALIWGKIIYSPKDHPRINQAELQHIEPAAAWWTWTTARRLHPPPRVGYIRQLLSNRMLLGVYIGQYCINVITYFFLTWFPVYLVQERGMSILKAGFVASIPAVCGFIGGVLGGLISDRLIKSGMSVTWSRKMPIVGGMLLSMTMILCNYVEAQWMVVGIMALAFFGKGVGALGWAVVADTAPKQIVGLSGGCSTCSATSPASPRRS
jgi:ACS family glucarate transporter-like MFS transporter